MTHTDFDLLALEWFRLAQLTEKINQNLRFLPKESKDYTLEIGVLSKYITKIINHYESKMEDSLENNNNRLYADELDSIKKLIQDVEDNKNLVSWD